MTTIHLSPVLRRILRDPDATRELVRLITEHDGYDPIKLAFEGRSYLIRNGDECMVRGCVNPVAFVGDKGAACNEHWKVTL